jgi:hypothetical protein
MATIVRNSIYPNFGQTPTSGNECYLLQLRGDPNFWQCYLPEIRVCPNFGQTPTSGNVIFPKFGSARISGNGIYPNFGHRPHLWVMLFTTPTSGLPELRAILLTRNWGGPELRVDVINPKFGSARTSGYTITPTSGYNTTQTSGSENR